ncbi:Modification methylase PaeR7I [Alloactinosynnema sp. L-07]|uniref:Eco57I restriction-modification methylase domain-containing protein n=1 Tax=Alloactinosynnema sp. L-07 TaxID=1653480 RepID=UPI00065EF21D|nr:N-6 DNA methylase [Alloactinosynnema sp. L-07]CRK61315.1 Modification methylase PaeR7I [Alloactinosynnema sp. L-07]
MPQIQAQQSPRVTHGEVFTRRWIVEAILDLVGYTPDRDLSSLRLIEPSCGTGAFITPVVDRLIESWSARHSDVGVLTHAISAYDLLEHNVKHTRDLVVTRLIDAGIEPESSHRLATTWIQRGDYLLDGPRATLFDHADQDPSADFIVGNPPYIRLEDMPTKLSAAYRERWPTMSGRADVYIGFYERALRSLAPEGRLAFICADRWMRNQYGGALRSLVAAEFSVDAVWTMHDVDAFETTVSAYPAITMISRRRQGCAIVADADSTFNAKSASQLTRWIFDEDVESTTGPGFQAHRLPHWFAGDEMWPAGSPERIALVEYLNDNFEPLHDPRLGTRVSIGIATGADSVYVTDDPEIVERDRLLPIAMAGDTKSGRFTWGENYLVNPWEEDGTLVDLSRYPKLRSYFLLHREKLTSRHIAKKNPRSWHKTIDKVNHALTARPKILIQDMRNSINPVLDLGGHYPHHNLYYVVSDEWDIEVLGGLLLSRVAQAFIEAYSVRMRGNTLRFQAQYLKKIRVPHPDSISPETKDALRCAFLDRDAEAATQAARVAYKIDSSVRL